MKSDKKKVAVILNRNARRFNGLLPGRIAHIIPKRHIWVTGNLDEAKTAVGEILAGGFDCVFTGGGDGTIVTTVTVMREIIRSGKDYPIPPIGILKMGTGNAWAYAVGVKGGLGQLARVVGGGYYSLAPFPLIQVRDLLCPIAGVGWDARVLNDYYELTGRFDRTFFAPLIKNLLGYFLAAGTKTIPRFLQGDSMTEVKVTFIGRHLLKPDRKGNFFPITDRDDQVIYQGPASIVAAGTIPFFGYKMRVFPFAGKVPGTMHLRIANLDVGDALQHLRGFWAGTYFSHKIIDYITDGVRLTFEKDEPIEAGGDPMGYTRSVEFTVPDFNVNIVAFWGI